MKKRLLFGLCVLALTVLAFSNAPYQIFTELVGKTQFLDEKGTLTGSSVEIVREIQKRIGDDTKIEPVSWSRAYNLLMSENNVILFSTTLTEERKPIFQWVGPIFIEPWVFYVKKGSGVVINSLEDAAKLKKIGTYLNDARELYLKSKGFTNLDSAVDETVSVKKLEAGRIDAVLSSPDQFGPACESVGVDVNQFEGVFSVGETNLYIAFSKNFDKTIVDRWQAALKGMYEDGTVERIYHAWYPGAKLPTYKVVE
ncbi:MAG TPA: ABC transporter substrate-binding protein [Thermotogota bacterium]|nr:ABC transporter substrate-binding protein [Thermotogota bacterium]HNT94915.1 ABC transporter substrate-binding protein [Thermotogota bacterium]HPB88231.1 ABC transporter substrate-binding protein [Thermotogota bacterium]HPH11731.1 ABC transporter substrate-binding protein [Thermotogota bacterium]HPM21971.1 ABC transporter substrate-binding protein [Thermotogota bacterium]